MCHSRYAQCGHTGKFTGKKKGNTMSELSVLELEAQFGELLPEREALGVVMGSFGHSNFDTHGSFGHSNFDSHGSFGHTNGADTHGSFGHTNGVETHGSFGHTNGADTHGSFGHTNGADTHGNFSHNNFSAHDHH
jgi:hypothetical protein